MAIDRTDTSDSRLPDDLRFLSEQLAEDADYLERTFPANAPRNWRRAFAVAVAQRSQPVHSKAPKSTVQDDRRSARLFRSVAAAAAAVVLLTGWYAMDARRPASSGENPAAAEAARTTSRERIIPAGVLPGLGPFMRVDPPQRPRVSVPFGADDFNTLFTAPEQEAVIDVMNEYRIPEPSVRY